MKRNLCDFCKDCEDNDKSITFCFDICGTPIDILHAVEEERNTKGMKNKSVATSYCINIPEDATNEDVIKIVFPNGTNIFDVEWCNAPYEVCDNGESN